VRCVEKYKNTRAKSAADENKPTDDLFQWWKFGLQCHLEHVCYRNFQETRVSLI
jgi:hypothetical protein